MAPIPSLNPVETYSVPQRRAAVHLPAPIRRTPQWGRRLNNSPSCGGVRTALGKVERRTLGRWLGGFDPHRVDGSDGRGAAQRSASPAGHLLIAPTCLTSRPRSRRIVEKLLPLL